MFSLVMDGDLCSRLAEDLDGAFEGLVLAHQDRLFSIALRLLGDRRDAEEVAQDAFVRAYRALAGWEAARIRDLRVRPWLATIVVRLCRNRATRRRTPTMLPLDDVAGDSAAHPTAAATGDTPTDAAQRREEASEWAGLLAMLPPRYRVPLVLRFVDGLSFAEMASALGRPEGTLKSQVHRGLALLRAAHDAAARHPADHDQRSRRELSA